MHADYESRWSSRDSIISFRFVSSTARAKHSWNTVSTHPIWNSSGCRVHSRSRSQRVASRRAGASTQSWRLGRSFEAGHRISTMCVGGVTDGVREVMRETDIPIGFGVLTTDDIDQALARAGGSAGNKGGEVALAAIEMARFNRSYTDHGASDTSDTSDAAARRA